MSGCIVATVLAAGVIIFLLRHSSFQWKGQCIMLVVCLGVFGVFLQTLGAKGDMEAYLTLGRIVQEEYSILTEAKKSPLDDTPEITELNNQLAVHNLTLQELQKKAAGYTQDVVFRMIFPELIAEYEQLPDFSLEVVALPDK